MGGLCSPAPTIVARDLLTSRISGSDGTYLYFGRDDRWSRLRLSDGAIDNRETYKQFLPIAFDGKYLYGCKGVLRGHEPCRLRRREGDGQEADVATLNGLLWGSVLAVDGGTAYWARESYGTKGPLADIVATELSGGGERVLAASEQSPQQIETDDAAIYWVTLGVDGDGTGVRKVARGGQTPVTLGEVAVATSLAPRGEFLLVAGTEGLFRVPFAGGTPELVLRGAPEGVRAMYAHHGIDGVVVVGDDAYWIVPGKNTGYETLLRAKLPR